MAKRGKRPSASSGGRTPGEAGLAAGMAQGGHNVSPTNLVVAKGYPVPPSVKQVLGSGTVTGSGTSAVLKVKKKRPRVTRKGARVADRVFGVDLVGDLSVAAQQAKTRAKRAKKGKPVRTRDPRGSGLGASPKPAPKGPIPRSNRKIRRIQNKIGSIKSGTNVKPLLLGQTQLSQTPTASRPKKRELRRLNRKLTAAKLEKRDRVFARKANKQVRQIKRNTIKNAPAADRAQIRSELNQMTKTQRGRNKLLAAVYAEADRAEAKKQGNYSNVSEIIRDEKGRNIGARQVPKLNTRYRQGTKKEDLNYNLRLLRKDLLKGREEEQGQSLGGLVGDLVTEGLAEVGADLPAFAQDPERVARQAARQVSTSGVPGAIFIPAAVELATGEKLGLTPGSDKNALATEGDYANAALTLLAAAKIGKGVFNAGKAFQKLRETGKARVFTVGPEGAASTQFTGKTVNLTSKEIAALGALGTTKTVGRGTKALGIARQVGDSKIYRMTRKGIGLATIAGAGVKYDWTFAAAQGTYEAVKDDPIKTLETTARGLISGVTSPVLLLANIGVAARTGNTKPVEYMADAFIQEGEHFFHVYTSGDAGIVKEATLEDYGLINLMGAGWLTRPLWKGLPGKATRAITSRVPSGLNDGRSLAQVWDRWTADMRAAAETTVKMDREQARADKGMQDAYKRVYSAIRKVNNGEAGRRVKKALVAAYEREVRINGDKLAAVLLEDIGRAGDSSVSAREALTPNANMSDRQRAAQARKKTRPALTVGDLAVFLQSRDAPMSLSRGWLQREMDASTGTPDMIELRALEMAKELWEDGDTADLFRQVRVELKTVDLQLRQERDAIVGEPVGSRPTDQETAIAMERSGLQFVGGINPYRVDENGNATLERPEVMAKEKLDADLATAASLEGEIKTTRAAFRKLGKTIKGIEGRLGVILEADRKKRRGLRETAAERERRERLEKQVAVVSTEIADLGDQLARGADVDQIRLEIEKKIRDAEKDAKKLTDSIAFMREKNPDAAEIVTGTQTWTGTGRGKIESDLGYQIIREDLLENAPGTNRKHWWVVAPDGSLVGWKGTRDAAKGLASDHRALTPDLNEGVTAIAGTFQRDRGGAALDSEMRRPQIQEEYALLIADLVRRLKASQGTGGKRANILEHRFQEGFWAGGSEPSFLSLISISDPEVVRAVAAMIGYHFEQEAMAVFRPDANGPDSTLEITLKPGITTEQVDAALNSMAYPGGGSPGGSRLGNKAYFYLINDDDPEMFTDAFAELMEGDGKITPGHVEFIDRDEYQETITAVPEIRRAANSYGERWGGRTYAAGTGTSFSREAERTVPATQGGRAGRQPNPEDEVGFFPAEIARLEKEQLLLERARGEMEGRVVGLRKAKKAILSDLRRAKAARRARVRNYRPDYRIARLETALDRLVNERAALADRISMMAADRQRFVDQVRGRLTKEELDAEIAATLSILNIDLETLERLSPEEATRRMAELTADRDKIKAVRKQDEQRREDLFSNGNEADAEEIARLDERINDAYVREGVIDLLIADRRILSLSDNSGAIIRAVSEKSNQKRRDYEERWVAIFNTLYQQQLEHYRAVTGSEGAIFIPNKPRIDGGIESATPSFFKGMSTPRDLLRTGQQARAGDVDRSFEAWIKHIQDHYTFVRNLNMSIYMVSEHAFEADFGLGPQKLLTDKEIEALTAKGVDLDGYVKVNQRLVASPNLLFQVMAEKPAGGRDGLQGAIDTAVKQMDSELDKAIEGIEDPKVRAEAIRQRAIRLAQEGEGQKYYLIRKPVVDRLFKEERLNNSKTFAYFAKLNSAVTKAVLGTSFAWAFAQPIAEWIIWAADNPKAASQFMKYRVRRAQAIAEDPESARRLSYFGATTLGTDSVTSRSARALQGETEKTIKLARQTDMGYLIEEIVKIRALGNLDRMKGAAIREFAVLAEIDRNLSTLGRSAKAVKGQMDEIEKVAGKLKNMSDAERLRFLDSEEGRAAGEQIMKHIDDSLGNWTALNPLEKRLASVVFFYPFVRFSMNWVLRTYPKNHPVRWTLATVLGQMNAEVLEEYLKADPTYLSGWAAIPIWGPDSPVPVSLLQLNRIAVGGNSFFEFLGDKNANTLSLIANVFNPGVSIPAMALIAGRDRYGNPLEDKENPFGGEDITFGDQVREMAAGFARLSPLSREFLRYNSFHLEGPLSSPEPTLKSEFVGDKVRDRLPGDDPNLSLDALRRLALPFAIPEDIDRVAAEYQVNDLWERYGEALGYSSRSYSEEAARANAYVEGEEKWLSENSQRSWSSKWVKRNGALTEYKRTNRNYAQYLREWGTKQEAEDQADRIALALARVYKKSGAPLPDSNGLKERIAKPKKERMEVKERWESLNPGVMYPGYSQALGELSTYDSGGIAKAPTVNIKSVYTSDDRVGASVVKQLRSSSRKNLGKNGNVANPLDDPRTEIVEQGKKTIVTNYRGKEVVGNLTLQEVKQAERDATIGIDDDGKITTPKTRKAVAAVEGVGEQAAKLLDTVAKWEGQSGGRINIPGDEGVFINELAKITGMDARVLAAWTKSEGGNSFGDYNLLNIGHTGSGPNSAASNSDFSTPKSAAAATAAFLRGEWGGPGAGIPYIIEKARGKDPITQIKVIEESGWRTGSVGADPGYWQLITDVYNEQPPTLPANPKAKQALKELAPQVKAARKAYAEVAQKARAMGIEVDPLKEPGPMGEVSWGAKKARKIDGAWAGSLRILNRANRGDFAISSEKRTPEENAAVGGSTASDHLTTNTSSYAHDIPASGDDQGIPIAEAYHKRLKLNEPLAIGTYNNYTSRKYPGYTFQILWNVEGHYDHVHVGARFTGEDLPAGTYAGGPYGSGTGGGGSAIPVGSGGGGGSLPATGGGGGGGGAMPEMKFADMAKGFGGIESGKLPSVAETVAEASGNADGTGVESVAEQLAKLPKAKKKQKLPKFDPTTRI